MNRLSAIFKALGHDDRLRIFALVGQAELTISELVQILGLSQPRITQYIKSLEDVGLVQRIKEGSWVFVRQSRRNQEFKPLFKAISALIPELDPIIQSDRKRLAAVREKRSEQVAEFFESVAQSKSQLGDEYVVQSDIQRSLNDLVGDHRYDFMVDLGTGTGRMLKLFSERVGRGIGIDSNPTMLKVARHSLDGADLAHLTVRKGDIQAVPLQDGEADLVTLHQVLHFLDDPNEVLNETNRILRPGGHVIVVDFAAHNIDSFRTDYAHRRLGFSNEEVADDLHDAGFRLATTRTILSESDSPDITIWLGEKE